VRDVRGLFPVSYTGLGNIAEPTPIRILDAVRLYYEMDLWLVRLKDNTNLKHLKAFCVHPDEAAGI
jgi:hypothetical protein